MKINRTSLRALIVLPAVAMLLGGVAGCTSNTPTTPATTDTGTTATTPAQIGGTLNMYTPNEQNMLDALIPVFEQETGITVNEVTAGTGELYTRIQNEASNPQGDVLFGGGIAQAMANSDLWEPYTGANDAGMTDLGKNVGGYSTPYQADGSVLLVNTQQIGDVQVTGYADLLNPALKGKIAFGDPTNSSSAFAQLTNMLAAMGGSDVDSAYTSTDGWNYVTSLLQQTGGKSIGSSAEVAQDLANGEYSVALTYEALANNYVQAGSPVKIVYMAEGTVFLPSGVEIIKGAKNDAQAKAFCDWIQSDEAQQLIADKTSGRPLRTGITPAGLPALDSMKLITEDSNYVTAHRSDLIAQFTQILSTIS